MSETEKESERSGSPVFSSVSIKSDNSKEDGPNFSKETPTTTKRDRPGSPVFSSVSIKSDRSKGDGPNFSEETPTATKSYQRPETSVNIGSEINRWKALKEQRGIKSDEELATFLINRHQFETSEADIHTSEDELPWIFKDLECEINTFQKKELERFQKILRNENIQDLVKDYKDRNQIREAFLDITLHFLRCLKQDEHVEKLEDELVYICQLKSNLEKRCQCVFEGIANHGDSTLLNKIYTDLYITQGGGEQINTEHEIRQIEVASRNLETSETQIEFNNMFNPLEQDQNIRTVLTKGVAGIGKSVSVQKFVLDWAEGKENKDINIIFPLPFRELNLKDKERVSLMDLIIQFFPEVKGLNLTRKKVLLIFDGLDECRLPLKFDSNEILRDVTSPASLDVLLTNLIKGNLFPSALIWITTRPAAAGKIPPECIDRVTEVRGFNDAQKVEYFRKRFTDEKMANTIIDHVKKSKSLFIMCHIPVFCWISATVLQNILEKKRNDQSDKKSEDTPKTLTQMYTHFFRFQIQQSRRKYEEMKEYSPDIFWDKDVILSLGKLAFQNLEKSNLIFYDSDLEACGIDITKASVSGLCTQIFKQETGIITGTMYCFVHMSIQEFIAALYAHLFLDINKKNVFVQDHTRRVNNTETMIGLLKTAVDKALECENGHLDLFLRFLLGLSLESNRPLLRGLLKQEESNEQSNKEIVEYIKQKFEENSSAERSINLFYCLNELNDQSLVKEIQKHLNEGSLSSADLSPAQWSALVFVLLTSEEEMEEFELQKFKKSDECLIRLSPVVKTAKKALLNDCNLTDKGCSAIAKVLGSDSHLTEVNMSDNKLKDSGVKLLCDGLMNTKCELKILGLNKCELTEESCSALSTVLSLDSISLKELDLSNNNLQDSGVKLLSDGLMNVKCGLKILRLSDCSIGEEGYVALYSAVRSNPSHLTELDLSGNDPGESGVKHIHDLIQDHKCALKTVRLLQSRSAEEAHQYLNKVVDKEILLQRDLNLNDHKLQDSILLQICDLLKDKHCRLNKLILSGCGLTEESCSALASVLRSKPGLEELDMSNNNLQDSGVKKLHNGLQNTNCQLHKLRLSDCSIGEEGYVSLYSAVRSNPSHLTELDLSGNDPGETGVKLIYQLIRDPKCALKEVRLLKSSSSAEGFKYLSETLGINPLLQRELNLNDHKLNNTRVKQICDLLKDKHCRLNTLMLNNSCITAEDCVDLMLGFNSNPSHIRHLDLSGNKLEDSGMKMISDLLRKSQCKIQKLRLSDCSIGAEGYVALYSAVRSNPSHLIELDLSGNDPGESGIKLIYDLIQDHNCALKEVRLLKSDAAEEACVHLRKVLDVHPLLLKELNLSDNKLGELDGKKLSALLMDSHSKVKKIILNDCELTEKQCSAVAALLSCVKEIEMNNSRLKKSGVKQICDELKKPQCQLQILRLNKCELTEESCSALSTVLSSVSISLEELDLSNNNLKDSGVKLLSDGLMNVKCRLKILRLTDCNIGAEGYATLCSAVRSNPSHLIELDLSGNDPGESGVKLVYELIQDQNCALKEVRFFKKSSSAAEGFKYLSETLNINPLLQRELNLSNRNLAKIRLLQICDLLKDKHCRLNTLMLNNSFITAEGFADLMLGFHLNASHIRHLDLSGNKLDDSGMKKISDLLRKSQCKIQKLSLSDCSIGEEGYIALSGAVRSNPSHLIELDLSGNDPGESGVKHIYELIQDQNCALKTVRFVKSEAAVGACVYLNEVLDVHPLLVKELNLSDNKLGDLEGKKLSALLMDSHSKVKKIILNNCTLTKKQCSAVAALLSCVKEIEMNNSRLMDSGVKQICNELYNPQCQLQILRLSECSITEKGYKDLCSAVRLNPSHLIELDLSGNDPGESGVKLIYDLIQDQNCALKEVRFLKSSSAAEGFKYLSETLGINLLLQRDLNLNDHKLQDSRLIQICDLLKDKHCRLNKLILSGCGLTEESCSALASVLRSNSFSLKELDMSNNNLQDSGVKKLHNGLENTNCQLHKLRLSGCGLTEESCSALASVLRSKSGLKDLDMSNNNLQDSGVKKLHNGLENTNCQLHKLRLSDCSIGEEGYEALSKAMTSNPSHLTELDLSGNDPGESGVTLIYDLIQDHKCALKTVRLLKSSSAVEGFKYLSETLGINPLLQRDLNLNDHKLNNTRVKQICDLLKDKHCRLNTLMLNNSCITAEGCADLISGFILNLSHIIHLDLSGNKLEDSGMKKISDLLTNPQCKLQTLRLSCCSIGEEGYVALSKAVKSNPSHLTELDLRGNDPGESGVKHIYELIQDQDCALKKVRLLQSPSAEEAHQYLNETLGINPLLQRDLNLNDHKLNKKRVKQICDLLKDTHCRLNTLRLSGCGLTEESCSALASVLRSKSGLKELDMSNNKLQDSGVIKLHNGLQNTNCQLHKLRLSDCSIGEEGYVALCSAVRSNPSHLTELDLSGNDPGESGVKHIYDLKQDQNCALKKVRFLKSSSALKAVEYLSEILGINPLLQRDLNLNDHKLNNTRLKQISDLLKDKHCRLNTLMLCKCGITETRCDKIISALCSNPSHLRELNLSRNKIKDSGVKHLCDLLTHSDCKLEKLSLTMCGITDIACLAKTFADTTTTLMLLDLGNNNINDSSLNQLSEVLKGSNCKLRPESQGFLSKFFSFWFGQS
ncbi:uncharacterized protein [Misgurnus anguillicaudatus]|uniref:uncharacterized protein isoform X14 n=1 Tax=Misgurnus anguillicaudatus TaxID=75329 RepID=UPI003CCF74F1